MHILRCGDAETFAPLDSFGMTPGDAIPTKAQIDEALEHASARLVVLGSDAAFAAAMTRLMRTERLATEVAFVRATASPATTAYGLPLGSDAAELAVSGSAAPTVLIRDESGQAIVGQALWTGPDKGPLEGQVYADSEHVFTGKVPLVELLPSLEGPGVRVATSKKHGLRRRREWFDGRAVQLGTAGAIVVRDGVPAKRPVKRSSVYRHTDPMALVRPARPTS